MCVFEDVYVSLCTRGCVGVYPYVLSARLIPVRLALLRQSSGGSGKSKPGVYECVRVCVCVCVFVCGCLSLLRNLFVL